MSTIKVFTIDEIVATIGSFQNGVTYNELNEQRNMFEEHIKSSVVEITKELGIETSEWIVRMDLSHR